MRVAIFSSQAYEKESLDIAFQNNEITYFEVPLNENTVAVSKGYDAILIFVNDVCNKQVVEQLAKNGVKYIGLRCAGFTAVR